jgi:hypothetical protein
MRRLLLIVLTGALLLLAPGITSASGPRLVADELGLIVPDGWVLHDGGSWLVAYPEGSDPFAQGQTLNSWMYITIVPGQSPEDLVNEHLRLNGRDPRADQPPVMVRVAPGDMTAQCTEGQSATAWRACVGAFRVNAEQTALVVAWAPRTTWREDAGGPMNQILRSLEQR